MADLLDVGGPGKLHRVGWGCVQEWGKWIHFCGLNLGKCTTAELWMNVGPHGGRSSSQSWSERQVPEVAGCSCTASAHNDSNSSHAMSRRTYIVTFLLVTESTKRKNVLDLRRSWYIPVRLRCVSAYLPISPPSHFSRHHNRYRTRGMFRRSIGAWILNLLLRHRRMYGYLNWYRWYQEETRGILWIGFFGAHQIDCLFDELRR